MHIVYSHHILTSKYFIPELVSWEDSGLRQKDMKAERILFTILLQFDCFPCTQIQISSKQEVGKESTV